MTDKYKRIIAMILSAVMACSFMLPGTAFASEMGSTSAASEVAEEAAGTWDTSVYTEETVPEEELEEKAEEQQEEGIEAPRPEEAEAADEEGETAETADTSKEISTEEAEGTEETGDSEILDPEGIASEDKIEEAEKQQEEGIEAPQPEEAEAADEERETAETADTSKEISTEEAEGTEETGDSEILDPEGIASEDKIEEAEAEEKPEEEPIIPANILTYSNAETKEAKSCKCPVYDVVMTGEYDFNEGTYAYLEQILDKDTVAWLSDDLNGVLKDNKEEAEIILPFDICIIDGNGNEAMTEQDITVRIHMDDISGLDDTVLYHQVKPGEWEAVEYTAQDASNDELPYVEFATNAFSPFLFCEKYKIEEETDSEDTKPEEAEEAASTEATSAPEEDAPVPEEKREIREEKQPVGDKGSKEETVREEEEEKTETTKDEEAANHENYQREFSYEDDTVTIKAFVKEADVIPEHAQFYCHQIDEKSDEYLRIRQKMADHYGVTDDTLEIFPYDLGFTVGAREVEPTYGSVMLKFEFKKQISVEDEENVEVIHIKDGDKVQVLSDDIVSEGIVDDFNVELPSFSPVVITKTNVLSSPLKSVQLTDENNNVYFISKTSNIDNNGEATSYYKNSQNVTDTIDLSGSITTDVVIKYSTESTSYDWLYIQNGNGTILKKDADGKQIGDSNGKIGGGGSNRLTPAYTVTYRFDQETLKFVWRTDGSVASYGYYAVITPYFPTTPIPAYHIEELEDGTFALVFDKGGEIEAFLTRPEVQENIAPYRDNITEIRLHKDTTAITRGSFRGLSSLKKVTIPRNTQLKTIGKSAFAQCTSLKELNIPSTVTSIEGSALTGCRSLETVMFAPGNQMDALPDGLFKGLGSLNNVTLPVGLQSIPANLFYNCTSLTSVDVPEGITSIGENAFRNTRIVKTPDLSNVTSIGSQAFSSNPSLKEVFIPAGVTSVNNAFINCSGITDFIFEDETSFPTLADGFFQGMSKLKNVKLPGNLTKISNNMFSGCSMLEHVDIPDTVTAIGNSAFLNCVKLQDFEIPASIKTIGQEAFRNCDSLVDMVIPNTVTSIGSGLFLDCNKLLRMEFESGSPITSLPQQMFYGCTKLEQVKLPDGVAVIPTAYFRGCTSLKAVDLPENLTAVGEQAFYDCTNLEDMEFPHTLTSIGASAFYNCDSLTNVTIPNSVTSIGSSAFQESNNIKSFIWEEGSPMTTLNTYLFYGCKSLENLVLPTGLSYVPNYLCTNCSSLQHVDIPSGVTRIGDYAFDGCSKLTGISLPDICTQINQYAFRNTGLSSIEFPEGTQSIGQYAFYGTKLKNVTIPKGVTIVNPYAFSNIMPLETVVFEEGGIDVKLQSYAFSSNPRLKEFTGNGRITYIGTGALQNDKRLTGYIVDPKVTDVSSNAFNYDIGMTRLEIMASPTDTALKVDSGNGGYTFGRLTGLEELIVDRDLTSAYTRTDQFYDLNPDVHITIGKHVNNLDNMLVSAFTDKTEITFEGENDFTVTTRVANRSSDEKWSSLKGDFYVDPQGVVYKLDNTDDTASLFYIPKGITEYTVPAAITSVAGKAYDVTKVTPHTCRSADDLTALTFEDPSGVMIQQFAFTGCSSLQTINGKTELYPEEWTDVSVLCDFPIHTDQVQEQVALIREDMPIEGGDGEMFSFAVSISGQEKMDEENPLTYVYPTGLSARMDFAISNESNIDMSDRVVRIYFAFSGENYMMGNYPPGGYTLVNTATGSRYPFTVRQTDAKGVYYYDITGFKPGDTLAFNNQFSYMSPTSGGGYLRVWTENLSSEEAAEKEGAISQPGKYLLAKWYTRPTPYSLTKEVLNNPVFTFTSNAGNEDDENIYVRYIQYRIRLSSTGSGGTSYAKDYIKYIDMYDDLQLTEHMQWNPKIVEAVQAGNYYWDAPNLYAKVDNKWVKLCQITFPDANLVRNIHPSVVTDTNGNLAVRINWSYRNTYWSGSSTSPTAELPATTYDVYIGENAVQVKPGSNLWKMFREGENYTDTESEEMRKIANRVHETSHYTYSEDQDLDAQTAGRLVYMNTGFSMQKTMTGSSTFGLAHGYDINMTNSGLLHKDDIDLVTDALSNHYYIKPSDMDIMFADSRWGPFLKLDITSATLCTLPDKTVKDVYGNEFTVTDAQYFGIDPIPYNGPARAGTDASEVVTNAKFSVYWDETYSHKILELKNDAGEIQDTYVIGEGGDYDSLENAFKALGYVVTFRAQYTVTWDLHDKYTLYQAHKDGVEASSVDDLTTEQKLKYEYRLKSGRTDTIHINSSTKRTDMMLVEDSRGGYGSSSLNTSNTAYARDNNNRQVGIATWSGYIYRELSLSKSAAVNGKTWTSSISIPDDTVLDYTLSFSNSGDKYDVLPLADRMGGRQILLVPVRTNKNALFYAEGEEDGLALQDAALDIYTSGGIQYYLMNRAGIYKNVVIDGRMSDAIQVLTGEGYVDTLMIWYYQNLTGSTLSGTTSKSITYKALVDSSKFGNTEDENGNTVTRNYFNNQAWLGGHQTHRLYTGISGESEMIQEFSKSIVENPGSTHEKLVNNSLIEAGDEILYKLTVKNSSNSPATIRGSRIRDELPCTSGVFAWTKENVEEIYYVTEGLGSTIETVDPSYWYVDAVEPLTGADTASRGLYYIHWKNDFKIELEGKGEAWIYVKLKFPDKDDGNLWDDYIALNNGGLLVNYFYIDQRQCSATHELVDVVEGMIQKGVLDTGLSGNGKFQSEDTRHYYQNGSNELNGSAQEVGYYTVVYNSGNVRLYLEPMQDQLPKGFKFRGLINAVPRAADNSSAYIYSSNSNRYNTLGSYASYSNLSSTEYYGSSNATYRPIATVTDEDCDVTYKNASVSASTKMDDEGRQQVTFTFGGTNYDSALGKYYLNPGQAVRFGYMVTVEGYARTENVANNEIAMPIYDKYGMGIRMSDLDKVKVHPASYRDIALNDGGCELSTTEEEIIGHFHTKPSWARNTTEWFTSNISLQRLTPVPGVLKTVGGETYISPTTTILPSGIYGTRYTDGSKTGTPYTGTVARTSIVNWVIRAYNEGGSGSNSMEDYTIVDTVDSPYRFTGNFFYDYYSLDGTKMTNSSVPLFSLGGRTEGDTAVKISTGTGSNTLTLNSSITINGDPVSVDGGRATVQIFQDENGVETIKIRMKDNYHRLPPNTYMGLVVHTQYASTDTVLSKQFYNHVQLEPSTEFDPALVSQGGVLYKKDEEGDEIPYAIESGASVTMTAGYTSAARKQVTETGQASNTGWSDKDKNSILLSEKYSKFYYDLYIDLPKDDPTRKLVLIDALPEVGDHSPFVDRDKRNSEFTVRILGSDPGFTVWSSANLGESTKTQLTHSQYILEVAEKHEFETEDWEGRGTGWTAISLSDGISEREQALLASARSFRIIIDDPELTSHPANAVMGKNYQVQVRFNAELESPEDADPGTIAWNSFGYRYTVPIGATGMAFSLNAEPLKVGVQVPAVPYVIKDHKTPHNHYKTVNGESDYSFLIYTGSAIEALNNTTDMTAAEIAAVVTQNGRDFTISTLNVETGKSSGRTDYLDDEKKWAVGDDGTLEPTSENWSWINAAKYTIIELPWEYNGFAFDNILHGLVNNYTFTQNSSKDVVLRVTNVWAEKGSLRLGKTVTGPNFDANRKFTFTLQLKDGKYPAFGVYEYEGTNIRDGSLTFDDTGTASIQLKHGQSILLKGIPAGYTWKVTESEDEWYDVTNGERERAGAIETGKTSQALYENTRADAAITIKKTVTGNMGDKHKLFDFEVYIVDEGNELEGTYPVTVTNKDGATKTEQAVFTEGATVIKLRHDDEAVVSGLPVGVRYEVDELAASRKGYRYSSTNETGSLGRDGVTTEWTNSRGVAVPTGGLDWKLPGWPFAAGVASLALIWLFSWRKKKRTRI